ncbi:MAG: 6-phosphogluconolactonase [Acidimicrobiia bacterium]
MVRTTVVPSPAHAGQLVATHILDAIVAKAGTPFLLGCPAGRTPVTTYAALGSLARARCIDVSNLQIVMLDEYVVDGDLCDVSAHYSCRRFIRETLVDSGVVTPSQVCWPDPHSPATYDDRIAAAGGLDVVILGCGTSDGHVAFNPPGTPADSPSSVVQLAESTRRDNLATFPLFNSRADVPSAGATVGLRTIREARSVVMILLGEEKGSAFARVTAMTAFDPEWPASILYECEDGWLVADEAAAGAR